MISKNQIKRIVSLQQKKYRQIHQRFAVEGEKMVSELLRSNFEVEDVFVTEAFQNQFPDALVISNKDMQRISTFKSAPGVIAVAVIPPSTHMELQGDGNYLLLDDISDPGNLGTLIRAAAWFDFKGVICSVDTVDVFNSKVIQATMGGVFRLPVVYKDLGELLNQAHQKGIQSWAAVMDGKLISSTQKMGGCLVIGNESNGISEAIQNLCDHKITIDKRGDIESLNAAVAGGIIMNAFK